jgi:hypothetical protein
VPVILVTGFPVRLADMIAKAPNAGPWPGRVDQVTRFALRLRERAASFPEIGRRRDQISVDVGCDPYQHGPVRGVNVYLMLHQTLERTPNVLLCIARALLEEVVMFVRENSLMVRGVTVYVRPYEKTDGIKTHDSMQIPAPIANK